MLLSASVYGQKLKDKMNAMAEKAAGAPAATSSTAPIGASQYEMIEIFTKQTKFWSAELKDGVSTGPYLGDYSHVFGQFVRNEEGKVTSFNSGTAVNMSEFPQYYVNNWRDRQVFFINNYCFVVKIDKITINKPEDVETMLNWDGIFDFILCLNKEEAKSITMQKARELIKNYLIESQKGVDIINSKKEAEKAALRDLYSIKGKKVKSISIETSMESIRYKEQGEYKIVATLDDGKVIKAGAGENGFLDDYIITVTGMEGGDGKNLYNLFYATPTDKITLNVVSAYDPTKKASKVFKMNYEIKNSFQEEKFKFENRNGGPKLDGIDTRVEIKQVKDANTGAILLEYRIYDLASSKPHFAFKCKPETPVEVGVQGNRITTEAKGVGKAGGNGGLIKLVVDPTVTVDYNLITNIKGAKGQDGEAGAGPYGRDGSVQTVKQKVSF